MLSQRKVWLAEYVLEKYNKQDRPCNSGSF